MHQLQMGWMNPAGFECVQGSQCLLLILKNEAEGMMGRTTDRRLERLCKTSGAKTRAERHSSSSMLVALLLVCVSPALDLLNRLWPSVLKDFAIAHSLGPSCTGQILHFGERGTFAHHLGLYFYIG